MARMQREIGELWTNAATANPYFDVTGAPQYLGRGDDRSPEELDRAGEAEIESALGSIRAAVPEFAATRALHFGCGYGHQALAMAAHAESVIGFDVAPAMRLQAQEMAKRRGVSNCRFVNELGGEQRFDWIHSYQVFEYIEPERGYQMVAGLFDKLAPGGVCSLQFPLFRETGRLRLGADALWRFDGTTAVAVSLQDPEDRDQISLFDYDLNRLIAQMVSSGIELLGIKTIETDGHHRALIFGCRRPRENVVEAIGAEAIPAAPAAIEAQGLTIEPGLRYVTQGATNFEAFLGLGWSDVEDWGVWSSDREATVNLRVDPALRDTHVLKLYGSAFVNPEHPQILVEVFVNSALAVQRVITEPGDDVALEIPLQAIDQHGAAAVRLAIDSPMSPAACGLGDDTRELGFALEAISLEPIEEQARRPALEPSQRYEAQGAHSFATCLGIGWSAVEDWGVWSCDRVATINLRVDPALRNSHVLELQGSAFVNPKNPQMVIEGFVNSVPAIRRVITEPGNDVVLEIPLRAVDQSGTAAIRLMIDSPKSPMACGLDDDTRELGFALEAISLEPSKRLRR